LKRRPRRAKRLTQILRFAAEHQADLIVMGAQGHGAIDRLIFGSKTRDVVGGAACPVLNVRR